MIFKRFIGCNIFGYINYDISFNKDISFLVGGNGSGKTTALKLMNALVNPNFGDLIQIPFDNISLELEEDGKKIIISAIYENEQKKIKISNVEDEIDLPCYSESEFEYFSHRVDKLEELVEELSRKFSDHTVTKEISKLQSPIFLGLDRRRDDPKSLNRNEYFFERDFMLNEKKNRAIRARRLINGSIAASLMETEILVQSTYRRFREVEEKQSDTLRDSILLSAFQYTNLDPKELEPNSLQWKEKAGLLERQKEIKEALTKIGISDSSLSQEVDKFFVELTTLFEHLNSSDKGISLEWLLNKAQIDRMSKIVGIIDEHKKKVDNLYKPINDFLGTVNSFYEDSNKKIIIDTVGQVFVQRPNGNKCTIEGLSSGERQLLVIFAHSFFNRYNQKSSVFIIDEPELSLHLRWQEKFAETVFNINPDSQFILATHSPEIVGNNKSKAVECR